MPACSFGIWILFLHVNRSIRMKTDENSLYLGAFHRRKPPAENASLHACRAHDNHPLPLAAFVRRQCGGFRRAALRWAGAPGRRRSGALAPLRARCRAKPGSGRVGFAHPPPRRATQRQPPPPRRRTSPAPATVARGTQEGWGGHGGRRRLAARGPKGPRACQTKKQGPEAKPRPCFSGRFAPRRRPRPPGRLSFHRRQKGQRKARPHALWGRAHQSMVGRGAATAPPPGAKPLPMPYGQRRHSPLAAGRRPRATPPAVARLSPPA